jgi:hypothetical protein
MDWERDQSAGVTEHPLYRQFERERESEYEEDRAIRFEAWRARLPVTPMH